MLAEQDGHGASSAGVRKQHTKNQRRECVAWKQRTHNTRRSGIVLTLRAASRVRLVTKVVA